VPLLLDTGAIYALADADDDWHERMRDFLEDRREVLLTPVTVVTEAAYLIRSRLGPAAERMLLESLAANELTMESVVDRDLARIAELLGTSPYLAFVDASVVAIAERLKLKSLVTTDRRDFSRVRPKHVDSFELLP
jgi:predicted nucleic acid-binding protein